MYDLFTKRPTRSDLMVFGRPSQIEIPMAAWTQKRRDPLTLEERRKNAIQQLLSTSSSMSQADISRKLGVTSGCVSQWLDAYRKAGDSLEGLDARKHTGRPPELSEEQKATLVGMIQRGARV